MRDGNLRLDILTAYGVSGVRIVGWFIITAIIFPISPAAYALLVLIRSTLGLLNYTAMGLGPAMVHHLAGTTAANGAIGPSWRMVYRNGLFAALLGAAAGLGVVAAYSGGFDWFFDRPAGVIGSVALASWCIGLGAILRLFSDVPGAALTTSGHITLDNLIQMAAEIVIVGLALTPPPADQPLLFIVLGVLGGGVSILLLRLVAAKVFSPVPREPSPARWTIQWPIVRALLGYGLLVTVAALADYLYAPTDLFLINRLLDPLQIAVYAPAIQIDAALLITVSAIAAVILPRAARAFGAGRLHEVRALYLRSTLLAGAILLACALWVVWFSPRIFTLWLKDPMPATQAILPLVMVHTVAGGSSAIGRSILLAIGRVRAFTIAALLAGAGNVLVSALLVAFTDLGLRGVILGTILAVVARCLVWMPWYVLRATRS